MGLPSRPDGGAAATDDQGLVHWLWTWLRTWWPIVTLSVAILAVAALTAVLPDTGVPLDPDSTGPTGTRALVDVLEALDRPVEVVGPDRLGDADVVLLLDDKLGDVGDDLRERVRAGGRLIVADSSSDFAPDVAEPVGLLDRELGRGCGAPALRDVQTIRPAGVVYEVPDGATGCFATPAGSWLVIEPLGRGHVVSLGAAEILTNGQLGDADHATLVAQLLTPPGGGPIAIVRPTLGGPGDAGGGLLDLVPAGITVMLLQLLVAFGVVVLWRARRLGPPLVEITPVSLASAEQTDAVGALFARSSTRVDASARIARDARRRLARSLGLHDAAATDEIADAIAARTGQDGAAVATVLEPAAPADDADLLRATAELATVERIVRTATTPDARGTVDVH